jgi:hypothetical protein
MPGFIILFRQRAHFGLREFPHALLQQFLLFAKFQIQVDSPTLFKRNFE